VRVWRKQLVWALLLLATFIGAGEAQIRGGSDPGKPFAISPRAERSPPSPVRKRAPPEQHCLSRQEVHGVQARYRTINGRRCWYASKPADRVARSTRKPRSTSRRISRPAVSAECQEQAIKLEGDEKRVFLRQCMASKR
jgi:hypothetical protein